MQKGTLQANFKFGKRWLTRWCSCFSCKPMQRPNCYVFCYFCFPLAQHYACKYINGSSPQKHQKLKVIHSLLQSIFYSLSSPRKKIKIFFVSIDFLLFSNTLLLMLLPLLLHATYYLCCTQFMILCNIFVIFAMFVQQINVVAIVIICCNKRPLIITHDTGGKRQFSG